MVDVKIVYYITYKKALEIKLIVFKKYLLI